MSVKKKHNNYNKPKPIKPVENVQAPTDEEKIIEALAVVDGVSMSLNIRMVPKVEPNNQIAILGKGTKIVVINPKDVITSEGEEWYKVRVLGTNNEPNIGYAMKKYIKMI